MEIDLLRPPVPPPQLDDAGFLKKLPPTGINDGSDLYSWYYANMSDPTTTVRAMNWCISNVRSTDEFQRMLDPMTDFIRAHHSRRDAEDGTFPATVDEANQEYVLDGFVHWVSSYSQSINLVKDLYEVAAKDGGKVITCSEPSSPLQDPVSVVPSVFDGSDDDRDKIRHMLQDIANARKEEESHYEYLCGAACLKGGVVVPAGSSPSKRAREESVEECNGATE